MKHHHKRRGRTSLLRELIMLVSRALCQPERLCGFLFFNLDERYYPMSNPITAQNNQQVRSSVVVTLNGTPVTPLSLAWSGDNAAVAAVDPVTGLVVPTSLSNGDVTVTAAYTALGSDGTTVLSGSSTGIIHYTPVTGDVLAGVVDFAVV